MRQVDVLATVLLVVGAVNWGLVGIARFDLVAAVFGMRFGETSALSSIVYVLVALTGVYRGVAWRGLPRHTLGVMTIALGVSTLGVHAAGANKDIVDTASAAGSFKTLTKALQAADLVDTLKGAGPFTMFAPADEAFAKLPKLVLDDLLKSENKAKLRRILSYHVVPGRLTASEVAKLHSAKAVR